MITKLKLATGSALLALSFPLLTAPVHAETFSGDFETSEYPTSKKDEEMIAFLSKIFETKDATPIAPEQLSLAQKTMEKLLPDGSYSKMINDMIDKVMTPMMSEISNEISIYEIMDATGIYDESVEELDEEKRKAIMAIIDPKREQRGQMIVEKTKPLIADTMSVLEPAIRNGMARAYARKFTADQLTELNRFFSTPTGAFYAAESMPLQADPEVLNATLQAVPEIIKKMTKSVGKFEEESKELSKSPNITSMNDAQIAKLAGLMGVSVERLNEAKAYLANPDAAEAAGEAVEAAAEGASDYPYSDEIGDEPWYEESNWSEAERKEIKKLSDEHDAISEKSSAAYTAWETAYNAAVSASRDKFKADGWKPEEETNEDTGTDSGDN